MLGTQVSSSLSSIIYFCFQGIDLALPDGGADDSIPNRDAEGVIHSGWQSQRFCVYPQDLIIQFPTLVKLSQLTFLLHQFKIPRQIELYYFAQHHVDILNRDMGELGDLDQASRLILQLQQQSQGGSDVNPLFKKLGHFSLDDNMKTNYSARELKTVYVECSCQFLMIRFLKNHPNQ